MDLDLYWILADPADAGFLTNLGIKLGEYDFKRNEFPSCTIDEKAFTKLDPLWGRFYWGPEIHCA